MSWVLVFMLGSANVAHTHVFSSGYLCEQSRAAIVQAARSKRKRVPLAQCVERALRTL